MKLLKTPNPEPGTLGYKFCRWFVNNINFCHGNYYGTEEPKPDNKIFNFFYTYWFFPFETGDNPCTCCAAVRGLIYGGIIGYFIGRL